MWQKSLRETNSEATVTRFEFSCKFGRKSKVEQLLANQWLRGDRLPICALGAFLSQEFSFLLETVLRGVRVGSQREVLQRVRK